MRTLSFMDHFFQMEAGWPRPTDPMLEGYTALGFVAGVTRTVAPALARDRRDVSPPGTARQDGDDARRAVRRARRARDRRGVVRARAPRPRRAVPADRASASRCSRRRCRSASRCGATTTARSTGRHYQLAETLCRPAAGELAATADPDRRRRRTEDAASRRAVRRRVQLLRRRPTRSRTSSTCCAGTATTSGVTRTRSRSPRRTATSRPTSTADDVVRGAEALAAVGVSTLVTGAVGPDPAGWLESTFGPVVERLRDIESSAW